MYSNVRRPPASRSPVPESRYPRHRSRSRFIAARTTQALELLVDCQRSLQLPKPDDGYDRAVGGDAGIVDPTNRTRRHGHRLGSSVRPSVGRCPANNEIAFGRKLDFRSKLSRGRARRHGFAEGVALAIRRELSALIGKVSTAATTTPVVLRHRPRPLCQHDRKAAAASLHLRLLIPRLTTP